MLHHIFILLIGLAQAAIHKNQLANILNDELYNYKGPEKRTTLEIIGDVSIDDRLKNFLKFTDDLKTKKLLEERPEVVKDHASKWVIEETEEAVNKATRELYDTSILAYAATAIRPDKETLRPEFFL